MGNIIDKNQAKSWKHLLNLNDSPVYNPILTHIFGIYYNRRCQSSYHPLTLTDAHKKILTEKGLLNNNPDIYRYPYPFDTDEYVYLTAPIGWEIFNKPEVQYGNIKFPEMPCCRRIIK